MDKKIRIGVDSSEAKGFQGQLRKDAENLAREMIRSARAYSTSSKEVLKDIEDQIKAIEKRNRLDADFRKTRLESVKDKISPEQFSTQKSNLNREFREYQIQTKLLRDLIDTIKSTSKEEIREDRKGVYERISKSRGVDKLGVYGDEIESLKETIQQDIISDINTSEQSQKGNFRIANAVGNATRYGGMVASGNIGGAMMSGGMRLLMSNPITAAILLTTAFSAIQNLNMGRKLRDYSLLTGTSTKDLFGIGGVVRVERDDWDKVGLTRTESLQRKGRLIQAYGGELSDPILNQLIYKERGAPLSEQQILSATKVGRYSTSTKDVDIDISRLQSYLIQSGQSVARLPELMDTYLSISNQILQKTGSVNTTETIQTLANIGQSYGVSGVNLDRFTNIFQGGLSRSSNPQMQALQFRVMSDLNPNASLWEIQKKMRKPLEAKGYREAMVNRFKTMYGGSDLGKQALLAAFEPYGAVEEDIDKMWVGKKGMPITGEYGVSLDSRKKAEEYTSTIEQTSKSIQDFIEKQGAVAGGWPEKIESFLKNPSFENILSSAFKKGIVDANREDPTIFK